MLHRIRSYAQSHPFEIWLIEIACMSALFGIGYLLVPGIRNFGLLVLFLSLTVYPPTYRLVQRFSKNEYDKNPVSLKEQQRIGITSVAFAALGIACLPTLGILKQFGATPADNVVLGAIFCFGFSAILAMKLGYAARRSVLGKVGMVLPVIGIVCLLAFKLVLSAVKHI